MATAFGRSAQKLSSQCSPSGEQPKTRKEALEAGKDVSEWLLDPLLEEEPRRLFGSIHPMFMGGEHLPPDLPGEATIARIDLRSTTGDVTELRVRPGGAFLLYRFVDEYETEFLMPFDLSEPPLSMG